MNEYKEILDDIAERDRGYFQYDIPKELLQGLYWGNCYDIWKIAKIFGCGETTISRRMKEYGLLTYREFIEEFKLDDKQKEIFEGCMLGDGCLHRQSTNTFFQYDDKHKEFIDWLISVLDISDISSISKYNFRGTKSVSAYRLRTSAIPFFNDEYNRWYPDGGGTLDNPGRKIIPHDLKLTSVSMLFWYLGDGTCDKKNSALFFTNSLSRDDAKFLQGEIKRVLDAEVGITLNRRYDNYLIRLNKKAKNIFLELVKETGIEVSKCYHYKFGIDDYE